MYLESIASPIRLNQPLTLINMQNDVYKLSEEQKSGKERNK